MALRKKTLVVGLTYDLKEEYNFKKDDPPDANAEFDHRDTVESIKACLESAGHRVVKIGSVRNLIKRLNSLSVDIVFNIAEGACGRNRESEVPVILEMAGIPFVGSDGLTLAITLDKVISKKIFISENIPNPAYFEISDSFSLNGIKPHFPLIVKPRFEGSSKGLNEKSVVRDLKSLKRQAMWINRVYRQSALVERFIEGSEFTVAVIGNENPQALPVVQIRIDRKTSMGALFYTFSRIHSNSLDYICPAQITKRFEDKLKEIAIRTYRAVECRDFGRIDIRVDKDNNPYVLEINPLPSLSREDVFMPIAKYLGISFEEMILKILKQAVDRYGL
ncbi:MAG: ATP-grasp domain-containing protein [Candidatus Omnitrophica bacterium]|nr:ATP-grasp domain-containing protein [Candidatus Omnitrophota bacterium]